MALFGEKYGERVRTVNVPGFSLELCGGCHVRNTGEIGALPDRVRARRRLRRAAHRGGRPAPRRSTRCAASAATYGELVTRLGIRSADYDQQLQKADQLRQRQSDLENEMRKLRMQLVGSGSAGSASEEELLVDGIRVLAREVPAAPANELREIADTLRSKLGSGVVVIGTRGDGNVSLVAAVSKDLTGRVKAGELVKRLSAIVGGGGGGRADFAQAGGKDAREAPRGPRRGRTGRARAAGAVGRRRTTRTGPDLPDSDEAAAKLPLPVPWSSVLRPCTVRAPAVAPGKAWRFRRAGAKIAPQ